MNPQNPKTGRSQAYKQVYMGSEGVKAGVNSEAFMALYEGCHLTPLAFCVANAPRE
jgi:hypothetical protein